MNPDNSTPESSPGEPSPEVMARITEFTLEHDTVSWHDSVALVGPATTARIRDYCRSCYGLDDVGVPEWKSRIWLGLLAAMLAKEARQ
jgi:hypothetical protein